MSSTPRSIQQQIEGAVSQFLRNRLGRLPWCIVMSEADYLTLKSEVRATLHDEAKSEITSYRSHSLEFKIATPYGYQGPVVVA